MPKIFVGETFTVALISGTEKVCQDFTSKFFLSAENFCRGILYCCINFGYGKVWIRGGGVSRFSVENVLSHSAENFRRESFIVALISGTEKVWRRAGGVSRFSVENFLSHSAENFRRGILYCRINFR